MKPRELPAEILARRAIVYVRQSTGIQVKENLESQRRQYELVDLARAYGFTDVSVIDADLGRSASGTVERPGFRSLVGQVCEGTVGAVLCLEASRLARNGRDWHHLLELCGLVGAFVIDGDGCYNPGSPNDRLLLGLKGTMSEFELTLIRKRMLDAAVAKARRGELRMPVPVGYVWSRDLGLMLDPDRRIQDAVRSVFTLFDRLGSARQVFAHMRKAGLLFPRPPTGKFVGDGKWSFLPPVYRNVIAVLTNPFYAGAYAYGKSRVQTTIVDGVVRKRYGRSRAKNQWTALVRDHHETYITWTRYEQNARRLASNAYGKAAGSAKSGRGGQALLGGLLRCRRCGRMLMVTYGGRGIPKPRYSCRRGAQMQGLEPCITFGAVRPDMVITNEILLVVQPHVVEAALVAEHNVSQQMSEGQRALELERQQAEYDVKLAARRYESVDPDNRLVAAELEARWNAAIAKLRDCETRLAVCEAEAPVSVDRESFLDLARDLEKVWNTPSVQMRTKQRLVRTLIEEIIVDVEDATREIVLVIHWRGGQHSELRVKKPASGEHTKRAPLETEAVVREMSGRWPDDAIAATLNRMGLKTGWGKTWDAKRVMGYKRTMDIAGYDSRSKDGKCLTMVEAAAKLGVTNYAIRKLIKAGVLPARQVMFDAPWQIMASDLELPAVQEALRRGQRGRGRPCKNSRDDRTLEIPGI